MKLLATAVTIIISAAALTARAQIPGLEFLNIPANTSIGGVLSRIYVFGLSLVGISALVMLIFGGVMYMTAGDSTDRTTRARGYMKNAIWGLVLALLSFLILNTINPELVQELNLSISPVTPPIPAGGYTQIPPGTPGGSLGYYPLKAAAPDAQGNCKRNYTLYKGSCYPLATAVPTTGTCPDLYDRQQVGGNPPSCTLKTSVLEASHQELYGNKPPPKVIGAPEAPPSPSAPAP